MVRDGLILELKGSQAFFERSTDCLSEVDSGFRPAEGTYSVASHVAHAAQTVDWFIDGMFSPDGFDLDFQKHIDEAAACTSLIEARQSFSKAFSNAVEVLGTKSDADLMAPLPDGPVMGGAPRLSVISAMTEHTAHHRGALSVYSRLLGKEPKMPYGDM